ncbi:helix-turn-helix domain-containing protein [Hungatella sp.]|jgi:transcriptional regulator with XRE-family HTH domain|uniref:helix-turn-helix domain-containing protein n=1 Tax=Hungatella sp. TaxID=2613924 RepID=UPI003995AD45
MAEIYKTDYIEIKKIMAEKEIKTIKELAEKTGINRNTLSNILNGKVQPSSDVMEKLVFSLEIPPEKAGRIFLALSYAPRKLGNGGAQ